MRPPGVRTGVLIILLCGILAPAAGSVLLSQFAQGFNWQQQSFHSVLEGLGGFIAVALAVLLRMRSRLDGRQSPFLWVACGLLAMGILDIFHACVAPGEAFVWLHTTATYLGGLMFALVWVQRAESERAASIHLTAWVGSAALALAVFFIGFPDWAPTMLEDGRFTVAARAPNLIGGALFLLGAARFLDLYRTQPNWENFLFGVLCTLFGSAGMLFELSQLWDATWWWWHLLRFGAYGAAILYMAITAWSAETRAHDLIGDLRRSNQDLEDFASVASHDLQEPVRKIVSFSKLLQEDAGDGLPARAVEDLRIVTDGAYRMQMLVRRLLDLSRTGTQTMRVRRVSVGECARRAIAALDLQVCQAGAIFTHDPLPTLRADPTLLTAIYQNLIANSLKYVGDARPVVHLSAERGADGWILGVSDNGIGIPESGLSEIFKPFRRLHTREVYDGVGIGLAICRRAVERHSGRIWAEPQAGQGATFRFVLREPLDLPSVQPLDRDVETAA